MKRTTFLLPIIAMCCMLLNAGMAHASPEKSTLSPYSLSFTENKGQIIDQYNKSRTDIKFALQQKGVNIYIGNASFHYQWMRDQSADNKGLQDSKVDYTRVDVELLGADKKAKLIAEEEQQSYKRYYLPQTTAGIIAHNYNKLTYKNVYPGIDWVLYISAGKTLKYDFIVHPGANPADIKLQYKGAAALKLASNGSLQITTSLGNIEEGAPYTYLQGSSKIASKYRLENNILSFDVAAYDHIAGKDLVIDPTIDWSTYFGGANKDYGYAVATDSSGNAYICGHTKSTANIATSGAAFGTLSGNKDAFIAMYNGTGILQWATYYGGTGSDNFFYLATDTMDHVYACGVTASTSGIASSSAVQQSSYGGGDCDAYMVKFDKTGARIWGTYFGGTGDESLNASLGDFDDFMVGIAWDRFNNKVYLCGNTVSTTGITTSGVYQGTKAGTAAYSDGYIGQFNANGVLQWATYFGGPFNDKIVKVACDGNGYVYAAGSTLSGSGIASSSLVHQWTAGGNTDAFIVKFNASGAMQWSTYYGGADNDDVEGVATDIFGNVYIAGTTLSDNTNSNNLIASPGAFQTNMTSTSLSEAFIAKFNASGVRQWGTYFGGTGTDAVSDIAIDATGNVCISGITSSSGLGTPGAYHMLYALATDAFLAIFSPGGTRTWFSYLGGKQVDYGFGISYSRLGDLFLAGYASSDTGVATPTGNQPMLYGTAGTDFDAFIAKFKADTSAFIVVPFTNLVYCQGDSIHVPFGTTSPFFPGNVFTLQISDASGSFVLSLPVTLGTLTASGVGILHGKIPLSVPPGTGYRIRITTTSPSSTSFDNGSNITIKQRPLAPAFITNSPVCSGNDLTMDGSTVTPGSPTYSWTGPASFTANSATASITNAQVSATGYYKVKITLNGCSVTDSVLLTVNQTPSIPVFNVKTQVCSGDTIKLNTSSGPGAPTYSWTGPGGFVSGMKDTIRANADVLHTGYYVVTVKLGACTRIDSVLVKVDQSVTPKLTLGVDPGATLCLNDTPRFTAVGVNGGIAPTYKWFLNGNILPNNGFRYQDDTPHTNDVVRCIYTSSEVCRTKPGDTVDITLTVVPPVPPTVVITSNTTQTSIGLPINFTATPTFGGTNPTYKWFRNGKLIAGVTGPTANLILGVNIFEGDTITCELTSDIRCTNPRIASSNMIIIEPALNVSSLPFTSDLHIYPNPNTGVFTITGRSKVRADLQLQLINAIGQVVNQQTIPQTDTDIDQRVDVGNVAGGVYLLRVKCGDDIAIWRLTIEQK